MSSSHLLSVSDHLTNEEVIEFWYRRFSRHNSNQVTLDMFCDAIQSEYSHSIIKPIINGDNSIDLEELLENFYTELAGKVTIDNEFVCLNSLELFTRSRGLKNAIRIVFEDMMMRHKGQRSVKLNDTIVSELNEVKKMLD